MNKSFIVNVFKQIRTRRFLAILLIMVFGTVHNSYGQSINYKKELQSLYTAVEQNFYMPDSGFYREHAVREKEDHAVSYLWPLCALIQATCEMERAQPGSNYMDQIYNVIEKYDDPAPPSPGYDSYPGIFKREDRYYDDNQWIGIAAMDAYFRSHKKRDLKMGKKICAFMMTGYDTVSGGGLYWREGDKSTKNTCSNGPGIIVLMQLFQATHKKDYLDKALGLYKWTNKHLKSPDFLYYDNLNVNTGEIAKHQFSYNTGTMLESNVYLFEATKDSSYLIEAKRIAASAATYFLGTGQFRDDIWFNAVLLRGFERLYKHIGDNAYLKAFAKCTDYVLNHDKNINGLIGQKKAQNLVNQGGMLEILARLAVLQQKRSL